MLAPTPALAAAQKRAVSLGLLAGVVVGVLLTDDGQVAADAEADLAAAALVLRRPTAGSAQLYSLRATRII